MLTQPSWSFYPPDPIILHFDFSIFVLSTPAIPRRENWPLSCLSACICAMSDSDAEHYDVTAEIRWRHTVILKVIYVVISMIKNKKSRLKNPISARTPVPSSTYVPSLF